MSRQKETYGRESIPPTDKITMDSIGKWRDGYRSVAFDTYSISPDAQSFINQTTNKLAPYFPSAGYQQMLRQKLLTLSDNAHAALEDNPSFQEGLKQAGLSETKCFKGFALNDLVYYGESMIGAALSPAFAYGLISEDVKLEFLHSLGISSDDLRQFGKRNGVKLICDSSRSFAKGQAASHILTLARRFPSGDNVDECVFLDRSSAGTGRAIRSQGKKIMLVGTGAIVSVRGEEYEFAELLRVILHEVDHSEKPDMSQTGREWLASQAESNGLQDIMGLPPLQIGRDSWMQFISEISRLRDHAKDTQKALLATLADNSPLVVAAADHNIQGIKSRNDARIRNLVARSATLHQNVWPQLLSQAGSSEKTA